MKIVKRVEDIINSTYIKPGSVIYTAGNAAVPQKILKQLARDPNIYNVELLSVLLLGDVKELFSEVACQKIKHRIIFSGPYSREPLNRGMATYQLMHLSDIPKQVLNYIKPNVAVFTVAGPDNGGNYSYGTTVEGVQSAVHSIRENGGLVIVERNKQMPFVLGTTLHESEIDFMIDTDYALPISPVHQPDETAMKIGRLVTELYIKDGSTLQYGIGEVPEAVTEAILDKGVKDIGIYTELFADAMRKLIDEGVVTNKYLDVNFAIASIFLAADAEGYEWLNYNSSVQSRPCNFTNSILRIASQPKMVAINSAIGVDLHGNIWADSLRGRQIYSGIGGQADFLRGSYLSEGGYAVIAMKSTTAKGISKILDMCPEGITTTAISADPVIIVTENGAFDPRGLSIGEHAVGIAHLAEPATRDLLLKRIYDSPEFHKPQTALKNKAPKGFTSYNAIFSD
ncbi:MAG TPA: acetyl-CoA hydrolase/transferase C-terminal domain-containing protein [Bacteroidales bacterium]|nr:acetyl-CoA hydrolase/transferase C-terminal domain-containing protein [Bacteroidales bacterium]HRX96442.1 acetyl-CoA hydrolase/transferase C-terminal domain-containing protein [Bacteroidales bacterium]